MDALRKRIEDCLKQNKTNDEKHDDIVKILSLFFKPSLGKASHLDGAYQVEREFYYLFPQSYRKAHSADLELLISLSKEHYSCFWGLSRIAARWLVSNKKFPHQLQLWTAELLRKETQAPKSKRGAAKKNAHIKHVKHAADTLSKCGIPLSKNTSSTHFKSGYDLIVRSLKVAGKDTTYAAIHTTCTKV